jgi:hypothetical protein
MAPNNDERQTMYDDIDLLPDFVDREFLVWESDTDTYHVVAEPDLWYDDIVVAEVITVEVSR